MWYNIYIRKKVREKQKMEKRNIYEDCGDLVAEYEARGMVPMLYIDSGTSVLMRGIKKYGTAGRYLPAEYELVSSGETGTFRYCDTASYILFAKNEQDAMLGFRMRMSLVSRLNRNMPKWYAESRIYGIGADGSLHDIFDVPMFVIKDIKERELDELLEYSNDLVEKYKYGGIMARKCGDEGKDAMIVLHLNKITAAHDKTVTTRICMMNNVWAKVARFYDTEVLDDRCGDNQENIRRYMSQTTRQIFAKHRTEQMLISSQNADSIEAKKAKNNREKELSDPLVVAQRELLFKQ